MSANKVNDGSTDEALHTVSNKIGPLFPASITALVTFPTQPIVVALRQQQVSMIHSRPIGFFSATKKIILENPKNLWKGTLPSAGKEFLRYACYKVWIIQNTQNYVDNTFDWGKLPNNLVHPLSNMVAGVLAGSTDVVLSGALERYSTYIATSQGHSTSACFSSDLKSHTGAINKIKFLYRGVASSVAKSSIGFCLMFGTKEPIRQIVNKATSSVQDPTSKWYVPFFSSVISGGIIALATAPLDIVKTLKQMPGGSQQGTFELLKSNFLKHGVSGLTTGLPAKFFLVSMSWAFNYLVSELANQSEPPRKCQP